MRFDIVSNIGPQAEILFWILKHVVFSFPASFRGSTKYDEMIESTMRNMATIFVVQIIPGDWFAKANAAVKMVLRTSKEQDDEFDEVELPWRGVTLSLTSTGIVKALRLA